MEQWCNSCDMYLEDSCLAFRKNNDMQYNGMGCETISFESGCEMGNLEALFLNKSFGGLNIFQYVEHSRPNNFPTVFFNTPETRHTGKACPLYVSDGRVRKPAEKRLSASLDRGIKALRLFIKRTTNLTEGLVYGKVSRNYRDIGLVITPTNLFHAECYYKMIPTVLGAMGKGSQALIYFKFPNMEGIRTYPIEGHYLEIDEEGVVIDITPLYGLPT